jgi:molybdenum cofactor sulfurtransferase
MIDAFSQDMMSGLFGNPHSMSLSSQLSTTRIDDLRLRVLRFFNADPDEFDLVFVANATAAIKLIADTFRDTDHRGFWYGYHVDAHTSLIGVRELADLNHQCFMSDADVDKWIPEIPSNPTKAPRLFAFPGQSNMNGRRLPLRWCKEIRAAANGGNVYTLLDAASMVSTSALDINAVSPDFTALSFYKIFGFPDLGALIVKKSATHLFERRRFFGGGTVEMVLASGGQWHAKKESSLHARLEDGTLPFHSIIALDSAISTHEKLYGSMENISFHTAFLARLLYDRLSALKHWNETQVCQIYHGSSVYGNPKSQGPIIAFNLRNSQGQWVPKSEVEKLASVQNIQMRTGTVCNPGGAACSLGWTSSEIRNAYSKGLRCGNGNDFINGRPTGVCRVSLGAMTNMTDIETLANLVEEFYVEKTPPILALDPPLEEDDVVNRHFYIESLSVFPIKSCGAFKIPENKRWEVKREGLAWDREWCLIHQGTGAALNQKRYPRMALIRPSIDLERGVLRISYGTSTEQVTLEISLGWEETSLISTSLCQNSGNRRATMVCGDQISLHAYASPVVSAFFSDFLGVPCTLARFPSQSATRFSRPPRLSGVWKSKFRKLLMPGSFPPDLPPPVVEQNRQQGKPLTLSNEMPILVVSRSSVNRLNETIKASSKQGPGAAKAVAADVFRGNIVVAERLARVGDAEQPYAEDHWSGLRIGPDELRIDVLEGCQRCQMVSIDQFTGLRRSEPFSTLAKTRNIDGKVQFGRYAALSRAEVDRLEFEPLDRRTVMVGDVVTPTFM